MMLHIERQHEELWDLAQNSQGQIIPLSAADPRHKDIVERVKNDATQRPEGVAVAPWRRLRDVPRER